MTEERAYEILELDKDASKEEIKKKYENFMRLTKFDKSYDEKLITEAFDFLMGYSWGEVKGEADYYAKGINKKKIENFFYHYSRHLLYGIIALVIFGAIAISVLSRQPKPDVGVLMTGDTFVTDSVAIETAIEQDFGFEFVRVIPVMISLTADGEVNSANMTLLATTLQGGEGDVIFTDLKTLTFLAKEDTLEDLSLHFDELGIDKDDSRIMWMKNDIYNTVYAAGINLGDFNEFDDYLTNPLTFIAIPDYTRNTENAFIMMKQYIDNQVD
ncbi:MAG: hypothetical protein JXQ23_05265 [Clostridia bacterium]|nr:hypothetical protein [Clostridia bacterium]